MTEPTPRQTRLHELFTAASQRPPAERESYLHCSCPDDPALVREVLALLRAADSVPDDFLTTPPPPPDPPSFMSKAAPHPPVPYDPAKDTLPGRRLKGRYTFRHRLGEGGMSVVYEGEQDHPHRRVAIKIMRPQFVSPKVLRRFRDEPEILAQLNHPHIVRVFEAGVEDFGELLRKGGAAPDCREDGIGSGPQPYFVMEYVEGVPLTEYARQHRLRLRDRLELFAIVCDAVQEAHQKGIIHRDLKPSNILVTAEGKPKLLDFGVAKVLAASGLPFEHTLTGELQLIGTLQYMSPEQCAVGLSEPRPSGSAPLGRTQLSDESPNNAPQSDERPAPSPQPRRLGPHPNPLPAGEGTAPPSLREGPGGGSAPVSSLQSPVSSLDTRSDVYALGVLLYELVTERLPYDVSNMTIPSAARTICETVPTPPSHFDRRLRGDLDAIILKALEKNRTRRYASAAHLEDDVRRYLSGEPVEATSASKWRRVAHWISKHPVAATATGCITMTLLTAVALASSWFYFTRVPYQVRLSENRGAELVTTSGIVLYKWPNVWLALTAEPQTPSQWPRYSSLVECGGRRMAVLSMDVRGDEHGAGLFIYDVDRSPDKPIHASFIEGSDDFGFDPMGRSFSASKWACSELFGPFDIFDEKDVPGPEFVAVFANDAWSQHVIRIYDLQGRFHYQVLFDGSCGSCLWSKKHRLLVFGSDRANFDWRDRVGGADCWGYPTVVFALRPERRIWSSYLFVEPDEFGDDPTDRPQPAWLRCVVPLDKAQHFDGGGLRNHPHDDRDEQFWIGLCVRSLPLGITNPMGFELACSYKGRHLISQSYRVDDPYRDALRLQTEWPVLPRIPDKPAEGETLMTLGDLPPIKPSALDHRRNARADKIKAESTQDPNR